MTEFILTNRERRENVVFIVQSWQARGSQRLFSALENPAATFFDEMAWQILASQKASEVVTKRDWFSMTAAHVPETIERGNFGARELVSYALDPPVFRPQSKGKVIDWIRLAAAQDTWMRLLPQPSDPDVTVDVMHAASGGALKARAFQVVHHMMLRNDWTDPDLARFSFMGTARMRKRVIRMGLVDLPEGADRFADLKAFSRACHAVFRIGDAPALCGIDPIAKSGLKCETCDATRMASCPLPHCSFRRQHVDA